MYKTKDEYEQLQYLIFHILSKYKNRSCSIKIRLGFHLFNGSNNTSSTIFRTECGVWSFDYRVGCTFGFILGFYTFFCLFIYR